MWQDFRFALRQLRKSPVFALVAVLTLALGIGANTAIFTLLDQALLRMLPVSHPEQLVRLRYEGSTPATSISTAATNTTTSPTRRTASSATRTPSSPALSRTRSPGRRALERPT